MGYVTVFSMWDCLWQPNGGCSVLILRPWCLVFFICLPFRTLQVSKVPQDRFKQKRSFFFSHPLILWKMQPKHFSCFRDEECHQCQWFKKYIWELWQPFVTTGFHLDWSVKFDKGIEFVSGMWAKEMSEWDSEEQAAKKLRVTLLQNCEVQFVAQCGIYFLILLKNYLWASKVTIWYRVFQLQKVLL